MHGCALSESPGLGEGLEAAVVGLLGLGREAAAGKLFARQVVAYAVAARALAAATRIRTRADLQVFFFLTFHIRLSPSMLFQMSSAKLHVRPILLKKIVFVIFFNNRLTSCLTICSRQKDKIKNGFCLLLSRPNLQFCRSLFNRYARLEFGKYNHQDQS